MFASRPSSYNVLLIPVNSVAKTVFTGRGLIVAIELRSLPFLLALFRHSVATPLLTRVGVLRHHPPVRRSSLLTGH